MDAAGWQCPSIVTDLGDADIVSISPNASRSCVASMPNSVTREIGEKLKRDRTVIWREVTRNGNADGDYHALMAHARATQKARRPKRFKLSDHPQCARIGEWMGDGWSPRLIAQMLAQDNPDDKLMQVSHETIYQCLYVQTRGSLRADLHKCLSTKRPARKPHGHPGRTGVV